MCGIAGIFAYGDAARPVDQAELRRIREAMVKHGPHGAALSMSAKLIKLLEEMGVDVDYSDPHIPTFPVMTKYKFEMKSVELTSQTLTVYHCVLLAADHDAFDYNLIKQKASLIVGTRGVYGETVANLVEA